MTSSDITDVGLHLQDFVDESDARNASDCSDCLLNEFEEIERLIKENTAAESNDEDGSGGHVSPIISWTNTADHNTSEIEDHTESSDVQQATVLDVDLHPFMADVDKGDPTDDHGTPAVEENKLVATFGTTEKFEALLEQQLHNSEVNDNYSEEEKLKQDKGLTFYSQPEDSDNSGVSGQSRGDVRDKKKSGKRTTRSPAANRVVRAQRSGRPHFSYRESSDDVSVRSDVSRSELRQRLKRESRGRRKDKEVVKQLQTDYDDLLTKYAEAENVIDQLRVGAKIDLFAKLPSYEDVGKLPSPHPIFPDEYADGPSKQSPHRTVSSQSAPKTSSPRTHSQDERTARVDGLTEKSLQLPFVATMEFDKVALNQQAQDLKVTSSCSLECQPKEHCTAMTRVSENGNHLPNSLRNLCLKKCSLPF